MSETEQEQGTEPETEPEVPFEEPEPETAAEEAAPEPEPETTPEDAEPQLTPEEMERRYAKISTSFKTYQAAVERNLEEGALDLIPCPLCFGTAHPSFVNKHDAGRVPEEIQDAVRLFFGLAREGDYDQDPATETCPACHGKTKVKTGALAGEHIVRTCQKCKGYGFVPPPGEHVAASEGNGMQQLIDSAVTDAPPQGDRDPWGEPRILPDGTLNDNYAKMPQFKKVHPVYGVTANLSVLEV